MDLGQDALLEQLGPAAVKPEILLGQTERIGKRGPGTAGSADPWIAPEQGYRCL